LLRFEEDRSHCWMRREELNIGKRMEDKYPEGI
jgi:hypothetical protein